MQRIATIDDPAVMQRILAHLGLPAWTMLLYRSAIQFLGGLAGLAAEEEGNAFWAHAGGFVTGLRPGQAFRVPGPCPGAPGAPLAAPRAGC